MIFRMVKLEIRKYQAALLGYSVGCCRSISRLFASRSWKLGASPDKFSSRHFLVAKILDPPKDIGASRGILLIFSLKDHSNGGYGLHLKTLMYMFHFPLTEKAAISTSWCQYMMKSAFTFFKIEQI